MAKKITLHLGNYDFDYCNRIGDFESIGQIFRYIFPSINVLGIVMAPQPTTFTENMWFLLPSNSLINITEMGSAHKIMMRYGRIGFSKQEEKCHQRWDCINILPML